MYPLTGKLFYDKIEDLNQRIRDTREDHFLNLNRQSEILQSLQSDLDGLQKDIAKLNAV